MFETLGGAPTWKGRECVSFSSKSQGFWSRLGDVTILDASILWGVFEEIIMIKKRSYLISVFRFISTDPSSMRVGSTCRSARASNRAYYF